jgi:hypothetical protein
MPGMMRDDGLDKTRTVHLKGCKKTVSVKASDLAEWNGR